MPWGYENAWLYSFHDVDTDTPIVSTESGDVKAKLMAAIVGKTSFDTPRGTLKPFLRCVCWLLRRYFSVLKVYERFPIVESRLYATTRGDQIGDTPGDTDERSASIACVSYDCFARLK